MNTRRVLAVAAAALAAVASGMLPVTLPMTAAAAAPQCGSNSTNVPSKQASANRPVIFVHGWTANGSALTQLGKNLSSKVAITPYYFDYGQNATTWAASPIVEGCLASYITEVSAAYQAGGGDGKVIVVAHSMGGLATLYASASPDVSARLGDVITLDTPYLGSPFGNTELAALVQGWDEFLPSVHVPPAGSNAQVCLGLHQSGAKLPGSCTAALPPYLPKSVPLTQIAGQVTVRRTLLGIHLYDISLDSDGIVPTESSHGYLEIQSRSNWPSGGSLSLSTDACTINSDTLQTAAVAAKWSKSALVALAAGVGQFAADNNALDGLLGGKLTPGLVAYLGAATLSAPCSHIHIYNDPTAITQVASAISNYLRQHPDSATKAARKTLCPDVVVTKLRAAGGFARAFFRCPSAGGQSAAGSNVIFAVHQDGSMSVLTSFSSTDPITLLVNYGIPLATQAQLDGASVAAERQHLLGSCGETAYSGGDTPLYDGFDAQFPPDGFEIDAGSLDGLENRLSPLISSENRGASSSNKIFCVEAVFKAGLRYTVATNTSTMQVDFIAVDGLVSTHTLGLKTEMGRTIVTLDGRQLN